VASTCFSVPVLDVSAVAGFKARIPCDIDPPIKDETVIMVFWYKDEKDGEPIYSVDARGRQIAQAKLWSDPYVFGERAVMRTDAKPAKLEIDPLESTDGGVYRCRVDFRNSPTKNQKINLAVVGESRREKNGAAYPDRQKAGAGAENLPSKCCISFA